MRNKKLSFLLFCLILVACNPVIDSPVSTSMPETALPSATPAPTATSIPSTTATTVPENALKVCLAEEPSAYLYDPSNSDLATQSLFDLIYVDMFAAQDDKGKPAYLSSLPSLENGDIEISNVPVDIGQKIMLNNGHILELSEDELPNYLNYGLVEVDDEGEYQTVQTQIIYKLKADLKWSDNQDLTSADFVFAYQSAKASSKLEYQWLLERTASFEAQDQHTLIWKGIPGFVPADSSAFLWLPLPEHRYGTLSAQEIYAIDASAQLPVSWGPYQIVSWEDGKQINLQPNSNFVLQTAEFPAFENLTFIIQPELEAAISMLETGECDVLDPSYRFDFLDKEQLEELAETHNLVFENGQGSLDLVFGIMPASYDVDYYSPWISERQDFFGSLETRKAISACVNAPELVAEIFHAALPDFVSLPDLKEETEEIDPLQLLEEVGWLLPEDDPEGIRVAEDVPNVMDGTRFSLRLLFGEKEIEKLLAEALRKNLGQCGIGLDLIPTAENKLFEPGPQGSLYGRAFDLALVSWPETEAKACERYLSDRIPSPLNNWDGINVAGLISPGFDELCTSVGVKTDEDDKEIKEEDLIQEYLPSISLLPDYRIWAYSQRLTLPDDSGFSDLWKFELSD